MTLVMTTPRSPAYWEDWAHDVADISAAQITRIKAILAQGDPAIEAEFGKFVDGLRDNLNDSISTDDAISMLSQHLITKPVFDALFSKHDFASHDPVSSGGVTSPPRSTCLAVRHDDASDCTISILRR